MNYEIMKIRSAVSPDSRYGGLSFVEGERDIPFAIKRIYCIYETEKGLHRGFHAHKLNYQLLFCPYGKIDIIIDDGMEKETVTLNRPDKGLILTPGLWREMIWRETGSVLCVAASEYYDPKEYIRNYDEFLTYAHNDRRDKNES